MPQLILQGQTQASQTVLDHGITDLLVHQTQNGTVLYTTSGPNGGVAAYAIGPDGTLTLLDWAHFDAGFAGMVMDNLALLDTATGPQLVVAGDADGCLTAYSLGPDGRIDAPGELTGVLTDSTAVLDVDQGGGDMVFLANAGTGSIQAYSLSPANELAPQFAVTDTPTTYAASVFALETVTISGVDYLVGASVTDHGVTAYRVEANGLVATGNLGVDQGIGIMTPTALATAVIGGRTYVLLGSAPGEGAGQSGAITVMELRSDGSLVPTDHVIDTLNTRFGMIQSLEVIESNGFTYVIAAGGDDGITLFQLLPNGRLQLIDVMADSHQSGLENVTALAAFETGDAVHLFAASEISGGVTEISLDTSRNGVTVLAAAQGGTETGTSLDDVLIGGAGNDLLNGSLGDDILMDGAGQDTLTGGGGRDIFVLSGDGQPDTITDFERGLDRLDLSSWPFLYDPTQLTVQSTADGAIVTWRGETLIIQSSHGGTLTAADIHASVLQGPSRPPIPLDQLNGTGTTLIGTSGSDHLEGGFWDDLLFGGLGDDTLIGGAGDDTLSGGHPDVLSNSDGADHFVGGEGSDWVSYETSFGSLRIDLQFPHVNTFAASGDTYDSIENVRGSQGSDNIRGSSGVDNILMGGRGVDFLFGRSGNDSLYGEVGNDVLFGGVGADLLDGGENRDRAQYSQATTAVRADLQFPHTNTGEAAGDIYVSIEDLAGSAFDDVLAGDAGDNRLFGREGADRLFGRAGDDYLNGGANADRLDGGAGNDTLRGGAHNDTFVFTSGHDVIEDFTFSHADRIAINDDFITVVAGLDGAEIVANFGRVENGMVILDFGDQGTVTVQSLSSLDGLADDIFVF